MAFVKSYTKKAVGLVVLALIFGGCKLPTFGQSAGATRQAQHENHLFQAFFVAGIIVGVLVFILIIWPLIFHRRKSDEIPRQFFEHIPLEIVYTVIPFLIIIGLFTATVLTENKVDAVTPNPSAKVTIVAYQWGWRFEYPNGPTVYSHNNVLGNDSSYPTMVLPLGETTRITLRSLDVVHGFYVRDFNFSRYAQPGVTNVFDLTPTQAGYFVGQCTQFCGLNHDLMLFRVHVVSPNQFQTWIRTKGAML